MQAGLRRAQEYGTAQLIYFCRPKIGKKEQDRIPAVLKSRLMYNHSKKLTYVFTRIDMQIGKKATATDRELAKRFRIRKLPAVAITDRHGNIVYLPSQVKLNSPNNLQQQLMNAARFDERMNRLLRARLEKAEKYLNSRPRQTSRAVSLLSSVAQAGYNGLRLVGFSVMHRAEKLLQRFTPEIKAHIKRILQDDSMPTPRKIAELRKLKTTYPRHPALRYIEPVISALRKGVKIDFEQLVGSVDGKEKNAPKTAQAEKQPRTENDE